MTVKLSYSIDEIRNEVRHLVRIRSLDPNQNIYALSQFFSAGNWNLVECEIETQGYSLMFNSIDDLLSGS